MMTYGHAYLQMISDPYKVFTNTTHRHPHTYADTVTQQHIQGHTQIQTHKSHMIIHTTTKTLTHMNAHKKYIQINILR